MRAGGRKREKGGWKIGERSGKEGVGGREWEEGEGGSGRKGRERREWEEGEGKEGVGGGGREGQGK